MRVLVFALACTLLAGLSASGQAGGPPDQFLIVPGERIGPIQLGMTLDDVVGILGRYTEKQDIGANDPAGQDVNYWWKRPGGQFGNWIGVQTPKNGTTVTQVIVEFDIRYALEGGRIHVGVPEGAVTAVMGPPAQVSRFEYTHVLVYPNISFVVRDKPLYTRTAQVLEWIGKVSAIVVDKGQPSVTF